MKLSFAPFAFVISAVLASYSTFASGPSSAGTPASNDELRGMATLSCSGSLVRLNRNADQNAVLLTNGRCAKRNFISPDDAVVDGVYDRGEVSVYFGDSEPEVVAVTRVMYAAMSESDVALIELAASYAELEARGAKVFDISDSNDDSTVGTSVLMISGYTKQKQVCTITKEVSVLLEDVWSTRNQTRFDANCIIAGGWAGSPMIDPLTQKIIGVVNTSNTQGENCTLDNPCEVDGKSKRMAVLGRTYGQKISGLNDCVSNAGEIDLALSGCKLLAPKALGTKSIDPSKKKVPVKSKKASFSKWPSF